MRRLFTLLAVGALTACGMAARAAASGQAGASMNAQANAQAAPAKSTSPSANSKKTPSEVTIAEGTKIDATLVSWLDARRSRIGDPVQARIEQDVKQGGKVVLKKGTQLAGHVTEARTRAGSQGRSEVGMSFERALLPSGLSIPFHASIVAIAAPPTAASTSGAGMDNAMASGGAMGTTQTSARGSSVSGATMNTSNPVSAGSNGTASASTRSSGRLSSNSKGVFGLEGLSLDSKKSSTAQGSTIVSTTKNVRLSSGTEMLLRVSAQAK